MLVKYIKNIQGNQVLPITHVSAVRDNQGNTLTTLLAAKANSSDVPAAQIQSDWNLTDNTAKDYIKNKPTIPTIPTNVSTFTNDAGYAVASNLATVATTGSYSDLTNKPAVMGGSGNSHSSGLVPDPGDTAGTTKFLREDGTWQTPTASVTGELIHYLTNVSGTVGTADTDCSQWVGSADGVTALYSGLTVSIKTPVAGVNVGITLNVNSLGAHPVLLNASTLLTTHYAEGCIVVLTYDADATASVTIDSTATEITGCWKVSDYNTNTTYSAGTAALLTAGTNTSNRVWLAKILADYIAYPNVKYTVATQSKSGALSIDGSNPLHVVTATGNITSVTLSTAPAAGHSTHVIITATAARTVAVAHDATNRVCPGATNLSLSITKNGYVELDFLNVNNKIYVRGV